MIDTAEEFRKRAAAYEESATKMLETFELPTRNVVLAIVGLVRADTYTALAGVLDYQAAQRAAIRQEILQEKQKSFADKQNEIRLTGAVGSTDEWNRLVNPAKPEPVAGGT